VGFCRIFCELFPELFELNEERKAAAPSVVMPSSNKENDKISQATSWTTIVGILAAVVACTWAVLAFSI
jgi:hypothetical protein